MSIIPLICLALLLGSSQGFPGNRDKGIPKNEIREETLDSDGKFLASWESDFKSRLITFQLTVETLGYVGFGLSPNGGMDAADIVIGGVFPNGTSYFSDRHGTGDKEPEIDAKQDWTLLSAKANGTHTTLRVSRLFDTCDSDDVPIGNDTSNLIWAYGTSDNIEYHGGNHGIYAVNLLDPPVRPLDTSGLKTWRIAVDTIMPSNKTFYGCTIHKAPVLPDKHHILGYKTVLSSKAADKHVHHWMVRQCLPQGGADIGPTLEAMLGLPLQDCESFSGAKLCQANAITWGVHGKPIMFPEDAGYAFGGTTKPSYYLLEIHYNNQDVLEGVKLEAGVDVYYTPKLRKYDVGSLIVGYSVGITQVIPPRTKDFITAAHCAPECMSNFLPKGGVNVFNVLLHSHLVATSMKVRHFRGTTELPWLDNNAHYHFNYQQSRPLRNEVKVLPSDQLTIECNYDSSTRPNVTTGGLTTQNEMCEAYLLYYPNGVSGCCGSNFMDQDNLEFFGIQNTTSDHYDPIVTAPPEIAGKSFSQVLNSGFNWTEDAVKDYQQKSRFGNHFGICGPVRKTVSYPKLDNIYEPPNHCIA